MPFQEGNKLAEGHGRKGYEYEEEQLKEMRTSLTKYLALIQKVLDDKESEKDYTKIEKIGADMRKIMDKLHASKEKQEHTGDWQPIQIIFNKNESTPSETAESV